MAQIIITFNNQSVTLHNELHTCKIKGATATQAGTQTYITNYTVKSITDAFGHSIATSNAVITNPSIDESYKTITFSSEIIIGRSPYTTVITAYSSGLSKDATMTINFPEEEVTRYNVASALNASKQADDNWATINGGSTLSGNINANETINIPITYSTNYGNTKRTKTIEVSAPGDTNPHNNTVTFEQNAASTIDHKITSSTISDGVFSIWFESNVNEETMQPGCLSYLNDATDMLTSSGYIDTVYAKLYSGKKNGSSYVRCTFAEETVIGNPDNGINVTSYMSTHSDFFSGLHLTKDFCDYNKCYIELTVYAKPGKSGSIDIDNDGASEITCVYIPIYASSYTISGFNAADNLSYTFITSDDSGTLSVVKSNTPLTSITVYVRPSTTSTGAPGQSGSYVTGSLRVYNTAKNISYLYYISTYY